VLSPDYKDILSVCKEEKVEYLIVNAFALAVHGLPRATGDIDLCVWSTVINAGRVWRALIKFGAPLSNLKESDLSSIATVFQKVGSQ
tara:strand:+ start:347 stop:607 length:261 start_codon:yes stop_codon:yes gene_type:complete